MLVVIICISPVLVPQIEYILSLYIDNRMEKFFQISALPLLLYFRISSLISCNENEALRILASVYNFPK